MKFRMSDFTPQRREIDASRFEYKIILLDSLPSPIIIAVDERTTETSLLVLHEISHRRPQTESNYETLKAAKRAAAHKSRNGI